MITIYIHEVEINELSSDTTDQRDSESNSIVVADLRSNPKDPIDLLVPLKEYSDNVIAIYNQELKINESSTGTTE